MFRTCYKGTETVFLDKRTNVQDGKCLTEEGYELSRDPKTIDWGKHYDTRIHLMRCHFALFVTGMALLLIGVVTGGIGCWQFSSTALKASSIVTFLAAIIIAAGMAFFHGYEYIEKNHLFQKPFEYYWKNDSDLVKHV